jgi:hypothetical protein
VRISEDKWFVKFNEDWWLIDTNMNEIFKQEGYELVGAAMEVYNVMGPGYLEEVYQECLERELALPYRRNTMPVAAFHGLSKIGVCLRFRG